LLAYIDLVLLFFYCMHIHMYVCV